MSGDLITSTFRGILAEAGPRQAEVLRRCAVARWWDLGVLAALRERDDGNARVLELLAGYSFVRPIGGGRYAYPDEVRAAMLAEWRAEQPELLRTINRRLGAHFEARVAAVQRDGRVKMTVADRAPGPWTTGDWELWEREALYHRLMVDPRDGVERLRAAFDAAEASYRLADAEALVQLASAVPLDEPGRLWLRYMRARLDRTALRLDEAAGQLEGILAAPALDVALAAEARQTLADVLAETGQWARAIELYRAGLEYFERADERRKAADVMLRLGEAYRGLGVNTGGWYVPAFPQATLGRALGQAWYWLLALPFHLVAAVLGRAAQALPRPRYLAAYQNWLLVRLYRTAQGWYGAARAAFVALGDESGMLRAERQQAEITLLFGYAEDALRRLDALRARPAAQDSYRRLWIDNDRAAALIQLGQTTAAQALLVETLAGFRRLGDLRGEAAALALQGRAAADAGDSRAALGHYRDALGRFRTLRYAAARELALYALRAWQRVVGPGDTSDAINALLEQEPEKRYVARFPRSLLPLLQAIVLGIMPLALLLTALVAPTKVVRQVAGSQLVETQTVYNLWNGFGAVATLAALSLAIYTTVALALMFFIPLDALEREQPDYLITGERGVARYDYRGALAQRLDWEALRRWIKVDRRLWRRPIGLLSLTFLEAADGRDLRFDGITGWYGGLQRDIALHLRDAGNPTLAEEWGFAILRSKCGALLVLGAALLLLGISAENSWIDWLFEALRPRLYAGLNVLAFSGVLALIPLTYWFVTRPLALVRALSLHDRWPWLVGAIGLAMVLLYLFTGGRALPIEALNIGLALCGVYILADVAYTVAFPRRRWLGRAAVAAALAIAVVLLSPRMIANYNDVLSATYVKTGNYSGAQQVGQDILLASSDAEEQVAAWTKIGAALYQEGRYRAAGVAYTRALELLPARAAGDDAQRQRAIILYNRALARFRLGDSGWQQDAQQACRQWAELCVRSS
jgi:hypothetical protein